MIDIETTATATIAAKRRARVSSRSSGFRAAPCASPENPGHSPPRPRTATIRAQNFCPVCGSLVFGGDRGRGEPLQNLRGLAPPPVVLIIPRSHSSPAIARHRPRYRSTSRPSTGIRGWRVTAERFCSGAPAGPMFAIASVASPANPESPRRGRRAVTPTASAMALATAGTARSRRPPRSPSPRRDWWCSACRECQIETGQVARPRHGIVHEAAADRLAGFRIIHGVFQQRLAGALGDGAVRLARRRSSGSR